MEQESTSDICRLLPPFWSTIPNVWFAHVENLFNDQEITDDNKKYNYVVISLDHDSISQITDLVFNPPTEDKYQAIKTLLIHRLTESRKTQIRQSLRELRLGDKKPSQLLCQIEKLADNLVEEELINFHFMRCMPLKVHAILNGITGLSLTQLADLADRILEYILANAADKKVDDRLNALEKKVASLSSTVKKLSSKLDGMERKINANKTSGRQRLRSMSLASSSTSSTSPKLCYYHAKFGDDARRCKPPCSFVNIAF